VGSGDDSTTAGMVGGEKMGGSVVMAVSIREFGLYVLFEVFNVLKMAY
jgi:hypothetical protein